jgi:hypothetical protein
LGSWKISYAIRNLESEIKPSRTEMILDDVTFHLRGKQVVETVRIEGNEREEAIQEAKQKIDGAINKLWYAMAIFQFLFLSEKQGVNEIDSNLHYYHIPYYT